MAQSLSKLYIHLIFHIKTKSVLIRDEHKNELYAYIGSIINDNESIPIQINGTNNHIHVLCIMSKNISLAKLIEEIKRHSSRWIKTNDSYYKNFAWQGGYGAFSYSQTHLKNVINYILNQEEHHKKTTFIEEYRNFVKAFEVEYDERYILREPE